MTLTRMIGFQAALIIGAALVMAFYIHFSDPQHRPPQVDGFFFSAFLVGFVSVLLLVIAWLTKPAKKHETIGAILAFVLLFIWWWIAAVLWVNTYGE